MFSLLLMLILLFISKPGKVSYDYLSPRKKSVVDFWNNPVGLILIFIVICVLIAFIESIINNYKNRE